MVMYKTNIQDIHTGKHKEIHRETTRKCGNKHRRTRGRRASGDSLYRILKTRGLKSARNKEPGRRERTQVGEQVKEY